MQEVYKKLIDVQGPKKEKYGNSLSGTGNRGMKACWSAHSPVFDGLLDYRSTHILLTCLDRVITSVSPDPAIESTTRPTPYDSCPATLGRCI